MVVDESAARVVGVGYRNVGVIAASRLDAAFSRERDFRRGASARRRASALFPIAASFGVRSRAPLRGGEAGMVRAA
jgi:hypothetical protein